jgi:hypothetical protein
LAYRNVPSSSNGGADLVAALGGFAPLNLLINETMKAALPLKDLRTLIFPGVDPGLAETAVGSLLALASRARHSAEEPSLLPCRIHTFFRGLPGLWACMDQACPELAAAERGGPVGKLYAQPQERCPCGAPVLEYFTCRYCGASYARAFTNDVADPRFIWANPGERLLPGAGLFESLQPLDLLLEEPSAPERGRRPPTTCAADGLIPSARATSLASSI